GSSDIDEVHLRAALAVWEYCESSAAFIFGDLLGDPVADEIMRALQHAPDGMTRTAIRDLFGRHRSDRIGAALALLATKGRARREKRQTGGRRPKYGLQFRHRSDSHGQISRPHSKATCGSDRSDGSDRSTLSTPLWSLWSLWSHIHS